MTRELFVSSTPHETKVAMVEDDQLAEVYFERENEYTLAGSIYKGRVTRVLPGMQSAFVDIGLERDAFLYVTDFLELQDEQGDLEEIAVPRETVTSERHQVAATSDPETAGGLAGALPAATGSEGSNHEGAQPHDSRDQDSRDHNSPPAPSEESEDRGWRGRRRRRGRRGRSLPESKFARGEESPRAAATASPPPAPRSGYQPIILPGESISKYRHLAHASQAEQKPVMPAPAPVADSSEPPSAEFSQPLHESSSQNDPAQSLSPQSGYSRSVSSREIEEAGHAGGSYDSRGMSAEESRAVGADEHPSSTTKEEESSRQHRYEQMNVASILGDAEAVPGDRADASNVYESENPDEDFTDTRAAVAQAASSAIAYGASQGTIEEEEIEEEESDVPGFAEELDGAHFEETEEETHEAGEYQSGNALGADETVQESEFNPGPAVTSEREAFAEQLEEENADVEDEVSEAELLADAAQEQAEAGGDIEARAEVRAPAGTAGYQQRVARPATDRRRGRRFPGRFRRGESQRPHPAITDLLKEGQEILVQIAKEPIGKKGARITSHIALPGRFLVYMPTVNHTGVSRKIASEDERQRLKRLVLSERENGHGGFIVRTAASSATEDELRADIRFLKNLWNEIKHRADTGKSPALIYHDLNLVERILRDQVTHDFGQIWVDNEQEYERVVRFVSRFQPALTKRVKLYTKSTPLFEQFNLQEEINKALKSKVWLKSGGYIVINQTEALVAIDVNTGKYVGKTARLEDTIVKTNVDAIKEIVRQIRLRDLGGIIVIDFIDMDERRNRQKVMQALEEALRSDRAPSKVLQFNDFGLVAITRKRVKQSLERTLGTSCAYCTGTGYVKSVTTVCNEIYTEMRKLAKQLEGADVMLRVNPEVGKALKANNGRWLQDMEELTGRTIIVKTDPAVHHEQFDIN